MLYLAYPWNILSTLNWAHLLRENFGYEGLTDMSTIDLICLYIDRCQRKKIVFCGSLLFYVRIGPTMIVGKLTSFMDTLAYPIARKR